MRDPAEVLKNKENLHFHFWVGTIPAYSPSRELD